MPFANEINKYNKDPIKSYTELSGAASKGFSRNTAPRTHVKTFADFRNTVKKAREEQAKRKEELDAEIKRISERYLPSIANPKIQELRAQYNAKRAEVTDKLKEELSGIIDDHKAALAEYTMRPASADVLSLLQGYTLRGGSVSQPELRMLLERCGNDFQALSIAKRIAEENGFMFQMPLDVTEYLDDLSVLQERTEKVISEGVDKSYNDFGMLEMHFFGEYEGRDAFSKDYGSMDERTAMMTGREPNVLDTLAKIRDVAHEAYAAHHEADEYKEASDARHAENQIQRFINERGIDLLTEEEKAEYRMEQALADAATLLDNVGDQIK